MDDITPEEADAFKKRQIAGYYAHCSALDECFGRLMTSLDELGLSQNTLVIFTSDHGDMLFSHNRGWKTKPWRESVGIPMLMRWPGKIKSDQESRLPISLVDLMPTILGLSNTPIPKDVQGIDLSWHPLDQKGQAPESTYINYLVTSTDQRHQPWRGVVTERHTYAETQEGAWLLYDDIADPYQMSNLLDDPATMPLQRKLHSMLQDWLIKTDDDFADSFTVAERYMKGRHVGCAMPVLPLEPIIKEGQESRKHLEY
jgi:arylsulfatase A-like enzyme